jgi:DNA repair exonuclease SbcCD ATPase subunit
VGKSTITDILAYGLFGKTIKHPKKIKTDDVINNKTGKRMLIEIEWDKYKVVRGRKPNKLELYEDGTDISQGGIPQVQEQIENKLGISFETFSNLLVFTDNNRDAFLELDTEGKRRIAENLLNLEDFKVFAETANTFKKATNNDIKMATKDYERLVIETDACKVRITKIEQQEVDWKATKKQELMTLVSRIKAKQEELESTDTGAALSHYAEAQEKIEGLEKDLPNIQQQIDKLKGMITEARKALDLQRESKHAETMLTQDLETQIRGLQNDISQNEKLVASLEAKTGSRCPTCYGQVNKDNFAMVVIQARNVIDANQGKIKALTGKLGVVRASQQGFTAKITKLTSNIAVAEQKEREVVGAADTRRREIHSLRSIPKPESGDKEKLLEQQLNQFREQAVKLKKEFEGPSPFIVLMAAALEEREAKVVECAAKKKEVVVIEELLPYYQFWEKGFGPLGIPMFAINGITPTLNSQIAYWMQFLIDGTLTLTFNGELEEKIERNPPDGDPYIYHIMSGGERRRLNLSVAAAFSRVMSLSAGVVPNILFLDEVTTNVDPQGVLGIYRMIMELSKDRKVFVTTHDQMLLELLAGTDMIFLQKKNGFTTVAK